MKQATSWYRVLQLDWPSQEQVERFPSSWDYFTMRITDTVFNLAQKRWQQNNEQNTLED